MYDKCLRVEGSECVTARTRMFKSTGVRDLYVDGGY
jgi:hypothetical protein